MTRHFGWSLPALLSLAVLQGCVMAPPPPPPHPHHEHRPPPPPPEFALACEGQAEGAGVQLAGPRGEPIQGTCQRAPDGRLMFMPAPPPPRR